MIDVAEWLAARTPAPPPELIERIAAIAGNRSCSDATELAGFLVTEAESLLENLRDDRSGAFDLLVADALITYAMEAAATDHDRFDETAARAMGVISAVAHRSGQA